MNVEHLISLWRGGWQLDKAYPALRDAGIPLPKAGRYYARLVKMRPAKSNSEQEARFDAFDRAMADDIRNWEARRV